MHLKGELLFDDRWMISIVVGRRGRGDGMYGVGVATEVGEGIRIGRADGRSRTRLDA